jgi:PAS domain S-box-containing protein
LRLLVSFLRTPPAGAPDGPSASSGLDRTAEDESGTWKEPVRASDQELDASREELMAVNEELKSTVDQLNLANEDLNRANAELQERLAELRMQSEVLSSGEVMTLFLDEDLRVRWYTPSMTVLFPLRQGDVGRRITDFAERFVDQDFRRDVRDVLSSGRLAEAEVCDDAGRWFARRIRPFLPAKPSAKGVAITYSDITERKRIEQARRDGEERVAADLAGMRRLYDLHTKLSDQTDLKGALGEILAAACDFTDTDRGCVHLVSEDGTQLEILAHRGYSDESPFIDVLRHERFEQGREAPRAERGRLIIEDIAQCPGLEGTAAGAAVAAEQIRAAQSTPMLGRKGGLIGLLSTQFREPHRPSDDALRLVDLLAWTAADFVERHRAEDALRKSEERFRALVTASSYAVYRMGPDWMEMRELDGRGFIADAPNPRRDWLDAYIAPDDQPVVRKAIDEAIAAKTVFELEHRVRRPDGGFGWTLSRAVPILDVRGDIVEWFGAASDITARKAIEERLRDSEEHLRRVPETETIGVLSLTRDGKIIDANDVFLKMSGWSREDVEGGALTWRRITPPEWIAESEAQMERLDETGLIGPYEKDYLRKDGSRSRMLFAGRDLGDGTIVEFVTEIVDRKAATPR